MLLLLYSLLDAFAATVTDEVTQIAEGHSGDEQGAEDNQCFHRDCFVFEGEYYYIWIIVLGFRRI